eukprot:c19573_g1_i1.p1 GENE.c19573_g1_i1~~c19573_g1_i1.p1  ORF type:complete len:894 (+),score=237.43 c19573_g1_i1:2-2683(+)
MGFCDLGKLRGDLFEGVLCLNDTQLFNGIRDCEDGSDEGAQLCGNGILDSGEECDDANIFSNDGCSGICKIEQGFFCFAPGFRCAFIPTRITYVGVEMVLQHVTEEDFNKPQVSEKFKSAVAKVSGQSILAKNVSIDFFKEESANSPLTSVGGIFVVFHVRLSDDDDEPATTISDRIRDGHERVGDDLETEIHRNVSVVIVQRPSIIPGFDGVAPVATVVVTSQNVRDASVAGIRTIVRITILNTSEPVALFRVLSMFIDRRDVRDLVVTVSRNPPTLELTVPEGSNGYLTWTVEWEDRFQNKARCSQGQNCTTSPTISIDTNSPVLERTSEPVFVPPNDDADRTVVFEFSFGENLYLFRPENLAVSCSGNCVAKIRSVTPMEIERDPRNPPDEYSHSKNLRDKNSHSSINVLSGIRKKSISGTRVEVDIVTYDSGVLRLIVPEDAAEDVAGNRNPEYVFEQELPEMDLLDQSLFIVFMTVVATLGIFIGIFFIAVAALRSTDTVRFSTPLFNYIMLASLLLALAVVPTIGIQRLGVSESSRTIACQSAPLLFSHSVITILSLLVARNFRVFRIFNNPKLKLLSLTNYRLLRVAAIPIGLNLAILVSWTVLFPPYSRIRKPDGPDFLLPLYYECSYSGYPLIFIAISIHLTVILMGLILGYKLRASKLPKIWRETQAMAYCFYTEILIFALLWPISMRLMKSSAEWFSIASVGTCLAVITPLWFIFGVKFRSLLFARHHVERRNNAIHPNHKNIVSKVAVAQMLPRRASSLESDAPPLKKSNGSEKFSFLRRISRKKLLDGSGVAHGASASSREGSVPSLVTADTVPEMQEPMSTFESGHRSRLSADDYSIVVAPSNHYYDDENLRSFSATETAQFDILSSLEKIAHSQKPKA